MTQTNCNLKAFHAYTDAGMTLFPCVGYSKIPKNKGFLELPFDPEFMPEGHNYGVLLRDRFLVIDCDPRSYTAGDKPLSRLLYDLELPADLYKQTFMVKTPRAGYHIYFSKPAGVKLCHSLKEYPGLEFKTKYIMACGSYIARTDKGEPVNKPYVVASGSPAGIIKAPQILLARLLKPEPLKQALDVDIVQDNPADIRAFAQYCQAIPPAVEGKAGDLKTFQVAARGREQGLTEATTLKVMAEFFNPRCQPPWSDEGLAAKVKNAFEYAVQEPAGVKSVQNEFPDDLPADTVNVKYHRDQTGRYKKNMHNLTQFMKFPVIAGGHDGVAPYALPIVPIGRALKYDQFSHRIIWTSPPPWKKTAGEWEDNDAILYKALLSEHLSIDYSTDAIHEVAMVCAQAQSFHPVREYLESCQHDGVNRLDTWLSRYCGALDNVYTRFVGRKVLIAAVARIMNPGCKFDHVLVTEGRQGIGKSYMWEILAHPWFTDAPLSIHDKGAVEVLQGKWVVELAEMDALSKYESQTIKGFLTRTEDRCRMAYGRKAMSFPRQNIFVGSINPEQTGWLKDRTGNRRFWPVSVGRIDLAALKEDRNNLWAEALIAYNRGENLYVDASMTEIMGAQVESRMQEDPWFGMIEGYLHDHAEDFVHGNQMVIMPSHLYSAVIGGSAASFGPREATRMLSILKILGFEKTREEGRIGYVYCKPFVREV